MSHYSRFFFLWVILIVSCKGTNDEEIKLAVIGGETTKIIANLVKFVNPKTNYISCGSGLVVNSHVVLTANHCIKEGIETLGLNGHTPVAFYNANHLSDVEKSLYTPDNDSVAPIEEILDLAVLVYPKHINLLSELKIGRIVGISPYAPIVSSRTQEHPLALVGFGLKSFANFSQNKKLPPEEKSKLFTKNFAINVMSFFNQGIMGFESNNVRNDILNGGFSFGDSGGVVLDPSYHVVGLITYYRTPNGDLIENDTRRVDYFSEAIDLTSSPAKRIMRRAVNCKENAGEICASWFSECGVESQYDIDVQAFAYAPLENLTRQSFRDTLSASGVGGPIPFTPRPLLVSRVKSGSVAESSGIKVGQFFNWPREEFTVWTDDINLVVDHYGRTGRVFQFHPVESHRPATDLKYNYISVVPQKLTSEQMQIRDSRSLDLGRVISRPDQIYALARLKQRFKAGFSFTVAPLWAGSSYRSLQVTNVERGTPAEAAGMLVGDYILEINDRLIRHLDDMERAFEQSKVINETDSYRIARFVVSRVGSQNQSVETLKLNVRLKILE